MDNVTGLINFENGITGKVSSNFGSVMPHDHQMRIFGTKGTVSLSNNEISLFTSNSVWSLPSICIRMQSVIVRHLYTGSHCTGSVVFQYRFTLEFAIFVVWCSEFLWFNDLNGFYDLVEFYGFNDFTTNPMISNELIEVHRFLWFPRIFNDLLWFSMISKGFCGFLWLSVVFLYFSVMFYESLSFCLISYGFLWFTMLV